MKQISAHSSSASASANGVVLYMMTQEKKHQSP